MTARRKRDDERAKVDAMIDAAYPSPTAVQRPKPTVDHSPLRWHADETEDGFCGSWHATISDSDYRTRRTWTIRIVETGQLAVMVRRAGCSPDSHVSPTPLLMLADAQAFCERCEADYYRPADL